MVKDYFQDITPSNSSGAGPPVRRMPIKTDPPAPLDADPTPSKEEVFVREPDIRDPSPRTIRNIQLTNRPRPRIGADLHETSELPPPTAKTGRRSRFLLWGGAFLAVLVLGVIALVALRSTTVTVTPRSHTIVFDQTAHFTAYPAANAAPGTLPYTLETSNLEDSEVVPTESAVLQHVEEKASGTITVFNEYSSEPVKLIKNTRFQTPEGLIFRVPADIVVPGKKGSVPGQISVTVFAESAGEQYNVAPVARFTLPGLKSNAQMYPSIYAKSMAAMTGGFAGDRPAVAPGALDAAKALVRGRLESKARGSAQTRADAQTTVFPNLVRITYESLPQTVEAGGGIRIHERAHVELPIFPADRFAETIAQSVSADASAGSVTLRGVIGFGAAADAASGAATGNDPLGFTLQGTAMLVWKVDGEALAAALAGRDEGAFQTIIKDFSGIEEARARIEPFWKKSFPADPSKIKIRVEGPAVAPNA